MAAVSEPPAIALPEHPVFSPRLRKCQSLQQGKSVHGQIAGAGLEQDTILGNQVMAMYSRLHSVQDARLVFDRLQQRSIFSWEIMIAAYARKGHFREALTLFYAMALEGDQANEFILATAVGACTRLRRLPLAKSIHWIVLAAGVQDDVVVSTSVLHMYAQCGDLQRARSVFDGMPLRNVVTWNAVTQAYAQAGQLTEAMKLFQSMDVRANFGTILSLLRACVKCKDLEATRAVHRRAVQLKLEDDDLVASALIDTYAKCGSFVEARTAFEKLKTADLVCWTAMLSAYTQFGYPQETLTLFRRMDLEGMRPDSVMFVKALGACASLGCIEQGEFLHARLVSEGLDSNEVVATALASMYRKCGSLKQGATSKDALTMSSGDSVSWNGMISAYAQHGQKSQEDAQNGDMALELLWEMQLHGVEAGSVTYLSALRACSHQGLLHEARETIVVMLEEGRAAPAVEHYCCIADALARIGHLREAHELLRFMPFEPNAENWRTLLSACLLHGYSEQAAAAAEAAMRLAPQLHEPYVMLCNAMRNSARREIAQEP